MINWDTKAREVPIKRIEAWHLMETNEIAILTPELELPKNHNCDIMGCGSCSHTVFRAPLDVMDRLAEAEALNEQQAEAIQEYRNRQLEKDYAECLIERDELKTRIVELKDEMFAVVDEVCVVGGLHDSTPNSAGTPVPLEPKLHELVANAISNLQTERDTARSQLAKLKERVSDLETQLQELWQ
ncbi:MAG: hypothetical protein WDA42_08310 [Candidatus Bathyarchaeia archaeon]